MNNPGALVEAVLVLLSILILAVLLRRWKILLKEHSTIFSRLVVKVTLPALIFTSLATTEFHIEYLTMALVMAAVEIACILLAWLVSRWLKLKRNETGALILVSAFGMTAMLGYPLISQVFPNNALAMEEAVITSEFGVGFLLFIIGPLIAMYFGQSSVSKKDLFASIRKFILSPVFISLIAGLVCSLFIPVQNSRAFLSLQHILSLVGNANTLLVALAVGLIIEIRESRKYILFFIVAACVKLILKPLMAYFLVKNPQFTDMMQEIVFIETAMPSALLGAVFAKHYNCKPELVSMTVMFTLLLSVITLNVMFILLF
jgi:predicted permease